jgi:GNAT superfamily N-acetyltransferase
MDTGRRRVKSVVVALGNSRAMLAKAAASLRHPKALRIRAAQPGDAGEIMTLQRAAFLSDAQIYGDPFMASLTQTVDEIRELTTRPDTTVLVARLGHRMVGSVRAETRNDTAVISRLMAAPDLRGHGIGRQLMAAIEQACLAGRYELSTGALSHANIVLYQRLGYVIIESDSARDDSVVTLAKTTPAVARSKHSGV